MNSQNKPPSVVLLHGLGRNRFSMRWLGRQLQRVGRTPHNIGYPSLKYGIPQLAQLVWAQITARGLSTHPLDFVTHSMGGIILRQMAASTPLQIRRAVMLAPPNRGTKLSDFFHKFPFPTVIMGKAGCQLGTVADSVPNQLGPVNFDLGVLAGTRPDNPLAPFIIRAPNDGRVAAENTKIQGMRDFLSIPKSHIKIKYDRDTFTLIENFLQHGKFKPVPASD